MRLTAGVTTNFFVWLRSISGRVTINTDGIEDDNDAIKELKTKGYKEVLGEYYNNKDEDDETVALRNKYQHSTVKLTEVYNDPKIIEVACALQLPKGTLVDKSNSNSIYVISFDKKYSDCLSVLEVASCYSHSTNDTLAFIFSAQTNLQTYNKDHSLIDSDDIAVGNTVKILVKDFGDYAKYKIIQMMKI